MGTVKECSQIPFLVAFLNLQLFCNNNTATFPLNIDFGHGRCSVHHVLCAATLHQPSCTPSPSSEPLKLVASGLCDSCVFMCVCVCFFQESVLNGRLEPCGFVEVCLFT